MTQKVPKAKINLNNKKCKGIVRIGKNDSKHDKFAKAELKSVLAHEGILSTGEYLSCNMSKPNQTNLGNIPQMKKDFFETIFAI